MLKYAQSIENSSKMERIVAFAQDHLNQRQTDQIDLLGGQEELTTDHWQKETKLKMCF